MTEVWFKVTENSAGTKEERAGLLQGEADAFNFRVDWIGIAGKAFDIDAQ